jgi:hypothetical protein
VISKILSITATSLFLFLLFSCGGVVNQVKVYKLDAVKGGLVREQEKEQITYAQGDKFLCESKSDFADTVGCVGGSVKVWRINASRDGLERVQANGFLTYKQANTYLCASKTDMDIILSQCANGGQAVTVSSVEVEPAIDDDEEWTGGDEAPFYDPEIEMQKI